MRIKKQMNPKRILLSSILIFTLIAGSLLADEVKFISIGMLQNWFSSAGCEIETGRTGETRDQLDGFSYPSLYFGNDLQAQKALWVGCKNYTDPLAANKVYDRKVVHVGPRAFEEGTQIMPTKFDMYGKFNHPAVFVDNVPGTDLSYEDKEVIVNENLKSDRQLDNTINTGMGISVNRKVSAYAHEGEDTYFIYEYTLTNNGICDKDGTVTHQQTLEDVVIFLQYRWASSKYGSSYGSSYYMPQSATWGHNTVNEVLHPDLGDDYYGTYSFHGLHSGYEVTLKGGSSSNDNLGAPRAVGGGTDDGFLGGSQFPGTVLLHADKAPGDPTNDPTKFSSANFFCSDDPLTNPPHDQFNGTKMIAEYGWMSKEISSQTHAVDLNYPHDPSWQDAPFPGSSDADSHPVAGGGGVSQGIGFGPYTLAPGDSVKISVAECVGDLSWGQKIEIGKKFYNEEKPYTMPDGTTTDDVWQYKDAWVFTSKDSLFKSFDKAINAYDKMKSGEGIATPPPPPASFNVRSGGDRITLEWSNNAESDPNFGGYKIYRQVGTPDTSFTLIYECGEGTENSIINVYNDKTAVRGFDYYYYITSFDNGQADPLGKTLESGLFWTRTIEPAYLRRPPEDDLDKIRIVPNPVNIKAVDYQFGIEAKNRLMFYNLPPMCDIKIFTERGDQIATIHHEDGSGDEEWNMNTSSRQGIVSGVYIAYIEAKADYIDDETGTTLIKKGESVVKKFVVIK